jgi:hypothetical protein
MLQVHRYVNIEACFKRKLLEGEKEPKRKKRQRYGRNIYTVRRMHQNDTW